MARDVFISYQSSDKECADRVCAALERQNISCWIAPRDIPIGSEWAAAIVEGIQRCHSFVVILSSNSRNARQISREAELADNDKLPIFTLRIENVEPPPGLLYFLSNVQWLDAFDDRFDEALLRLADVVRKNEGYPAEATKLHRTITSTPAPSASVTRPPSPVPSADHKNTTRIVAMVAICIALVLAGMLLARRSQRPVHPPPRMDTRPAGFDGKGKAAESAARAAAERFLNYRDSGDYAAAWREFTAQTQAGLPEARWTQRTQVFIKQFGQPVTHTIQSCTSDPNSIYTCTVSLKYARNLSSEDKLIVAEDRSGRWAISSSRRNDPK